MKEDFPLCDLLIVMGTSLVVHPFASLIDAVAESVPRLLINREPAGVYVPPLSPPSVQPPGLHGSRDFDPRGMPSIPRLPSLPRNGKGGACLLAIEFPLSGRRPATATVCSSVWGCRLRLSQLSTILPDTSAPEIL